MSTVAYPTLSVQSLTMRFGGLLAVSDVSFDLKQNEVFAIIGPNGAGKTTVFNCIGGFYRPTDGTVTFGGKNIGGLPTHRIARMGVVRTFQNIRLFKQLTVLENLLVAQYHQMEQGLLSGLLRLPKFKRSERQALENATWWIDFMGLRPYANREAGGLAYGHQRLIEIARCMITRPKLLMLDEPAAGLNPQEKTELAKLIKALQSDHQVSVLLIEHDMSLVMGISDRILVMENGVPIALDGPDGIRNNARVIKAYLGES